MDAHFLFEMAWKSATVSAGVWLLLQTARGHSPAQRSRLILIGLAFMAALPVMSLLLPPLEMTVGTVTEAATPQTLASFATAQEPASTMTLPQPVASPLISLNQLAGILWLTGVAAIMLRLAVGVLTLRRWSAAAAAVDTPAWTSALRRAGAAHVRLLVSPKTSAPMSWGWGQPTILLSPDVLADAANADAVIAHEIAHFRRRDWASLLFARIVVALFWLNPLVWLLERALLHEAEQAADAEAVLTIEPARYAETLVKIAAPPHGFAAAANSMAAGPLSRRILRVLEDRGGHATGWKAIASLAAIGLATPVAALSIVPRIEAAPKLSAVPKIAAQVSEIAVATPVAVPTARRAPMAIPATAPAIRAFHVAPIARLAPFVPMKVPAFPSIAPIAPMTAPVAIAMAIAPAASADDREIEEASRDMERAAERMRRGVEVSMRRASESMRSGADGMERGADGMLRGADDMRREAVRLRDPAYRQRKIAEEAARGHHVTDRELIEAIPQMEKGADEMVRGAGEMRRGAAEMRRAAVEHQ